MDDKFKQHVTYLKEGDKAPYFSGIDQHGNKVSMDDFSGKNIILFFYPKDDTEGCTAEACSLRDELHTLADSNYAVVGVSADDVHSHEKFARKYHLPYPLIADTDMSIIKAYDVWGQKMLAGRIYDGIVRTTFIIDAEGNLKHVITKVDTANHARQILSLKA
jgi:peroxiredoxin Q/BCP